MSIASGAGAQRAAPLDQTYRGLGYGLAAVVMWASYLSFARAGVDAGLLPQDIVFLRFVTAGALLVPWLLRKGAATLVPIGWLRSLVLAALAGPLFILLGVAGYLYAPLAHGAVVQPVTVTLASMVIAWVVLGERLTPLRALGVGIIVVGLLLIASGKAGAGSDSTWIGDLLFVGAGLCWAVFTILLKRWNVGGLAATAVVSLLSAAVVAPSFLAFASFERLAAVDAGTLVGQVVVHGLFAGLLAVMAFGRAVQTLGASRAALFPALVPAVALLVGIPVVGELPTVRELAGAALASIGLVVAMGLLRFDQGRGPSPAGGARRLRRQRGRR